MRTFRFWVTSFLLAWLPLQAAAVPLLAACCPDGQDVAMAALHCHERAAAADADEAPAHDGDHGGDHGGNPGHLCCPHFSAAPVHRFSLAAASAVLDAPTPLVADRSHIPEQPQRPPIA
jgi:hypothetical protein